MSEFWIVVAILFVLLVSGLWVRGRILGRGVVARFKQALAAGYSMDQIVKRVAHMVYTVSHSSTPKGEQVEREERAYGELRQMLLGEKAPAKVLVGLDFIQTMKDSGIEPKFSGGVE